MPDLSARSIDGRPPSSAVDGASRRVEADGFGEVAGRPGPSTSYWCPRCEVWGTGPACWSCDRTIVVRSGPLVDTQVYDPTI